MPPARASSTPWAGFGPDFLRFLQELSKNNNREWFTANKARYESSVQGPAVEFIARMGPKLALLSRHIVADARPFGGSLSRIYRDTRFSKDKSPYKTGVGIHLSHEGGPSMGEHLPGFFLHLGPGESAVYSGIWRPEPPALAKIRSAILSDSARWTRLRKAGITLEGEAYARVPSGIAPDHPNASDLKQKDFYAGREFTNVQVAGPGFDRAFWDACRELDPLNQFLARAIGIDW
jgi:uncharacterized protein (TIGR02453 family)